MRKKSNKWIDPYAEREAQKYESPVPSREFIIQYLSDRGSPATLKQIIKELHLDDPESQEAVRRRLIAMLRDGQLLENRRGAYGPIDKMELVSGRVVGHKDGFGFVILDEGGDDLFLSPRQMRAVFPNDRVLARVAGQDYRGRREALIVEIIERNTKKIVGRLFTQDDVTVLEPSNQRIQQDIIIPSKETQGADSGKMVLVEIIEQPTTNTPPIGKVITVLGDHMAPGMEIDVAIYNHGLPHEWPEAVLSEAAKFPKEVEENDLDGRLDLRHSPFVTIDGEDAKDFDDAVYCKSRAQGGWTLYVAIADVGHYVKTDSALDLEALNRGNSVYFPARVIPMLPEVLSNELCSLKPNVNRLALVCEMSISSTGKITRFHFHEAVIKSHARLTYNQVFAMMQRGDTALRKQYVDLLKPLETLFDLYHVLSKERRKRGALDFDLPETKIIYGLGRKIEAIIPTERNDAHKLIEECMLCANISAAHFLLKNEIAGVYRIHEGPSPEKLIDLRKFLNELGLKLPGRQIPTPKDYATLLKQIGDRPDAHLIQTVLLRSLSQAVYSPENRGHFGLAYDAYTHFTSPIRRYPDLIVHRAIRNVLRNNFKPKERDLKLEKFSEHCSMTERRADDATYEAIDWLKCEFMLDKVGEEFDGVISSVTSFGLFVELSDIYIEGLIHISSLRNDYYRFDAIQHRLRGERTGKIYRLGDVVRVKVAKVDLDERKIDLVNAGDEFIEYKKGKKSKKEKASRHDKLEKSKKQQPNQQKNSFKKKKSRKQKSQGSRRR